MDAKDIVADIKRLCQNKTIEEKCQVLAMIKGLWNFDYINGLLLRTNTGKIRTLNKA